MQLLTILKGMDDQVLCTCSEHLSSLSMVVTMTDEGPGGAFVNEHGYVHDMLCLSAVDEDCVHYQGDPETAGSWFPGFAWTIMNCSACSRHLGWRFSKAAPDVQGPRQFWGLCRIAIQHPVYQVPPLPPAYTQQ